MGTLVICFMFHLLGVCTEFDEVNLLLFEENCGNLIDCFRSLILDALCCTLAYPNLLWIKKAVVVVFC